VTTRDFRKYDYNKLSGDMAPVQMSSQQ